MNSNNRVQKMQSLLVVLACACSANAFRFPAPSSSLVFHRVVSSKSSTSAVWGKPQYQGKQGSNSENESTTMPTPSAQTASNSKSKTLGLLTFDLDDTLYPIAPVIEEANLAFAKAMERFGYGDNIRPQDIVDTGKAIREEIAAEDPDRAAVLTHTEIRQLAIRREMERITLTRKLKACADDWATPVSSLSPIVVQHAKK